MFSRRNVTSPDGRPSTTRTRTPSPFKPRRKSKIHDSLPLTPKSSDSDFFHSLSTSTTTNATTVAAAAPSSGSPGKAPHHLLFTLAPRRRQVDQGHSFLSLDLADSSSHSVSSMSLRRNDTVSTNASAARSLPVSPVSLITHQSPFLPPVSPVSPILSPPAVPSSPPLSSSAPSSSNIRRSSRETLRLPSPKPAPSVGLPQPPPPPPPPPSSLPTTATASSPPTRTSYVSSHTGPRSRRGRPSNLVLTLSACLDEIPPSSSSLPSFFSPQHKPSRSAPSVMSPISPTEAGDNSYFLFSPLSPKVNQSFVFPPPSVTSSSITTTTTINEDQPLYRRSVVTLKTTPSTRSSTATINTRNRNRSAALAALEGRSPVRYGVSGYHYHRVSHFREERSSKPRNFMSMSDDEDEEDGDFDEEDEEEQEGGGGEDADDEREDDEAATREGQRQLLSVLNEEEGVVIPSASSTTSTPTTASSSSLSSATTTTTSFTTTEDEENCAPPTRVSITKLPKRSSSSANIKDASSSTTDGNKQRSTIESLFAPLTNFIDFGEEENSGGVARNWRSFVEISS